MAQCFRKCELWQKVLGLYASEHAVWVQHQPWDRTAAVQDAALLPCPLKMQIQSSTLLAHTLSTHSFQVEARLPV